VPELGAARHRRGAPTLARIFHEKSRRSLLILYNSVTGTGKQPPTRQSRAPLLLRDYALRSVTHSRERCVARAPKLWSVGDSGGVPFVPLYVFCGDQLLVSCLRPSREDPARHVGAILSLLVKRLLPAVRLRQPGHLFQGSNPRFVVTNLDGDAQPLYEEVYCARGERDVADRLAIGFRRARAATSLARRRIALRHNHI